MQTIKIIITNRTPTNVVLKKCNANDQDVTGKIAELLEKINPKKEAIKSE